MATEGFNLKRLFQDSRKALLQPKAYFSTMSVEGGLGEPLLKALVYGVVAGIFVLLWSLLNLSGVTGGILGGAAGIAGFFGSIIGAVIGVFIGAVVVLIVSAICGGNTDFEPNMRVAATIMVLLPVNAFLGFFGAISLTLSSIISLLVNLYGIYMLYFAVQGVLKAREQPARVVSYVLGGVLVLFLIIGMATRSAVKQATGLSEKKMKEVVREYEEEMEKAQEKMKEQADEKLDEDE